MLKSNKENYTVLYFSESVSEMKDDYGLTFFPDLTIPTLNYSRIEKNHLRVDYSFFIPNLGGQSNKITEAHLLLSLKSKDKIRVFLIQK